MPINHESLKGFPGTRKHCGAQKTRPAWTCTDPSSATTLQELPQALVGQGPGAVTLFLLLAAHDSSAAHHDLEHGLAQNAVTATGQGRLQAFIAWKAPWIERN